MKHPKCLGYKIETLDGTDYDCEYPYAGEITCDHCKYGADPDGLDPEVNPEEFD